MSIEINLCSLQKDLQKLPIHMAVDPHAYSLYDLMQVRNGGVGSLYSNSIGMLALYFVVLKWFYNLAMWAFCQVLLNVFGLIEIVDLIK